ncbi:hypothetical protein F5I97DRAFT_1828262 [Phlebopus sp. FC_14]|nr:hypothetical protein F5I97DRAFT_1828262 [Phlebopus sp. FC_14]
MSSVFNTISKSTNIIIEQAIACTLTSRKGAIYRQEMQVILEQLQCVHALYTTGAIVPNTIIATNLHMCTLEEAEANYQWPSFKLICTPTAAICEHRWHQPANDGLLHALTSSTFLTPMPNIPTMSSKEEKGKRKAMSEDIDREHKISSEEVLLHDAEDERHNHSEKYNR